jgi:hypothetical protein
MAATQRGAGVTTLDCTPDAWEDSGSMQPEL